MKHDVLIAIKDGKNAFARKITLIQPYKRDGGFGVFMPYHDQRGGFLAKVPVNYTSRYWASKISEWDRYTADHRVKLSYHVNGFLQFSGEAPYTIRSGRDQETGEIKGLGLITKALSDPIMTGPSFGIQVWGLDDFEPLSKSSRRQVITITHDDLLCRDCTPETANAYLIEGFIFPPEFRADARNRNGRLMITVFHGDFQGRPAVFDMFAIPLPNQPVIMGILASRMHISTPEGLPPSGFWLSSASDTRHMLYAFYPSPPWSDPGQSLNYCPEPPGP